MSQRYGQGIADEMLDELEDARVKFSNFNSAHEGYAVLLEELDELWLAIKTKGSTKFEMRVEAIQVGAMAIRFIQDIIDEQAQPGQEG